MTPEEFKAWRTELGMSQGDAALELGISRASVQLYERGRRHEDGRAVEIPLSIELACDAVSLRNAAGLRETYLLTKRVREMVETVAALLRQEASSS